MGLSGFSVYTKPRAGINGPIYPERGRGVTSHIILMFLGAFIVSQCRIINCADWLNKRRACTAAEAVTSEIFADSPIFP